LNKYYVVTKDFEESSIFGYSYNLTKGEVLECVYNSMDTFDSHYTFMLSDGSKASQIRIPIVTVHLHLAPISEKVAKALFIE